VKCSVAGAKEKQKPSPRYTLAFIYAEALDTTSRFARGEAYWMSGRRVSTPARTFYATSGRF